MLSGRVLLLGVALAASGLAGTISIQPASSIILPGQAFSVDVSASNLSDLYAFQFDLLFNPAILSAISIAEGSFLPGGGATLFFPGSIDNVNGAITFTADTLVGAVPGFSGGGVLATVQFEALGAGTSPISFANVALLDSGFGDIPAGSVDGSVNVAPEPATFALMFLVLSAFVACRFAAGTRMGSIHSSKDRRPVEVKGR